MRRITLQLNDYDPMEYEEWSHNQEALLIAPDIALSVFQSDIQFHFFDKPIGDNVEVVDRRKSSYCEVIEVRQQGIGELKLEEVAAMTLEDLAGLLRK